MTSHRIEPYPDLKRCPWCDGEAALHVTCPPADQPNAPEQWWVACRECRGTTPSTHWNKEHAAVTWNTRHGRTEAGRAPLTPEIREALEVALAALAVARSDTDFVREEASATLRSFLSVSTGGTWCCQSCGEEFSEDPGSGHTVAVDDGRGNPIPERCGPVSWKSVAVSTEGK